MSRTDHSKGCPNGRDCGTCHPGKPTLPIRDLRQLQLEDDFDDYVDDNMLDDIYDTILEEEMFDEVSELRRKVARGIPK